MIDDRRHELAWKALKLGVFSLAIFPALGAIAIVIAASIALKKQGRSILSNSFLYVIFRNLIIISIGLFIISYFAKDSIASWLGLANFLPYFILPLSLPLIIDRTQKLREIARMFIITSPIVIILGFGQAYFDWHFSTIFGWDLWTINFDPTKMSSVFINRNFLGFYLLICLTFSLGLVIDSSFDRPIKSNYREKIEIRFLWLIIFASLTELTIVSSRNAWAISMAIVFAFALYVRRYYLGLFVMAIMGSIGWSAFGFGSSRDSFRDIVPTHFWGRLSGETVGEIPAAFLRSTQWKFALHLIQENPIFGWGLRNFTDLYKTHSGAWLGHPHNLFLMFGAEMGIPLALFFIGSIGWIVAKATVIFWRWDNIDFFDSQNSLAIERDYVKGALCAREISRSPSPISEIERSILFTYLAAFAAVIAFNIVDVSIYDLRCNLTGWLLFSAIVCFVDRKHKISDI